MDKKSKMEVIKNLKSNLNTINYYYNKAISDIENSKNNTQFLIHKKDLLLDLLKCFPLDSNHCIFCIENDNKCDSCLYKKFHGKCGETNSDYDKIYRKKTELKEIISSLYFKELK